MSDTGKKPAAPASEGRALRLPLWGKVGVHAMLLLATGVFVLPLVWMILTGLKTEQQTLKNPPEWLPRTHVATLERRSEIDIHGQYRKLDTPRREEMPVVKMRELESVEALVVAGRGVQPLEVEGAGFLEGQRLLVKRADLAPLVEDPEAAAWGAGLASGPALMRKRIGDEKTKRIFRCEVIESYTQGMWEVREYVPDLRQATKAGAGEQVTYAWGVVPADLIQERVQFMWQNVPVSLNKMDFGRMLLNTLWVCILGMIGTTFASALAAYGFAFGTFRGKQLLFAVTLATMMIPFPATMVPLFKLYREMEWIGTFKPLWVHSWFGAAFNIFLLRQFFLGLPRDLLDAARIDGCSELQIFFHVVVPLSYPALAMVALFHFLYAWKDFMGPLLYLTDKSQFTLSLGLQAFQSQQGGTPWHLVMAASAVFSLPLIALFLLMMKTFIRGIAMTGLKG